MTVAYTRRIAVALRGTTTGLPARRFIEGWSVDSVKLVERSAGTEIRG
jgi:hypothetical protein